MAKLDFVTGAGNMAALVTPHAVFRRDTAPGSRFRLESWNPAASLDDIVKNTGFAFEHADARNTAAMTDREAAALRELDPEGLFAAEVNA